MRVWYFSACMVLLCAGCTQNKSKQGSSAADSTFISPPQTLEEIQEISEVITRFVRAYNAQDKQKVNALLHPELGLTLIYRPGVADVFSKVDSIDFAKPVPEYYAYPTFSNDYVLSFEQLPAFDCGTEKWSKMGFFCDTTSHPNQLSTLATFQNELEPDTYSEAQIEEIKQIENKSYRIIVTAKIPLVFHVQLVNEQWFVTVLDRAYASCDA